MTKYISSSYITFYTKVVYDEIYLLVLYYFLYESNLIALRNKTEKIKYFQNESASEQLWYLL